MQQHALKQEVRQSKTKSQLTAELIDRLLDKLGSDDVFRALFAKDPNEAMRRIGAPADFQCGACLIERPLASKEQIQRTREIASRTLCGQSSFQPHSLEGSVTR